MRKKWSSCNIITRANHQLREVTPTQLPPSFLRSAGSMPPEIPRWRGREREREREREGRTDRRKAERTGGKGGFEEARENKRNGGWRE